eukprot:507332-Amphidinium_carterae.1
MSSRQLFLKIAPCVGDKPQNLVSFAFVWGFRTLPPRNLAANSVFSFTTCVVVFQWHACKIQTEMPSEDMLFHMTFPNQYSCNHTANWQMHSESELPMKH